MDDDFHNLLELISELATFQNMPEKVTNNLFQMKMEREFIDGFVAISDDDKLIGYATCFYAYYTWVGKSLYLDDLYVKKEFRGNGIGGKLIKAVIEKAKTEECKRVRWQVSKWNKNAIEFYKGLGAEIEESEANCDILF